MLQFVHYSPLASHINDINNVIFLVLLLLILNIQVLYHHGQLLVQAKTFQRHCLNHHQVFMKFRCDIETIRVMRRQVTAYCNETNL